MTFDLTRVTQDLTPTPSRRRPGRRIDPRVRFIVAHDSGNPGATARGHARYYRREPNPAVVSSAHLFVDDTGIIETIPAFGSAEQALHVLRDRPKDNQLYGVDANRAAIGVEYCFGGAINADLAYENYVWTLAALCHFHGLDPARDVVGHQVLDPGRKVDPGHALRQSGRTYEGLLDDVVARYRLEAGSPGAIGSGRIRIGPAETTVFLRRRQAATTTATSIATLPPGAQVEVTEVVAGERVSGNADWCRLAEGGFAWSGGLRNIAAATAAAPTTPVAPEDAAAARGGIVARAIDFAIAEWVFFGRQTYSDHDSLRQRGHRENEAAPYWDRIGRYWREGTNTHGWDGRTTSMPWSAAFISWVLTKAGAVPRFRTSKRHATYISQAIRDRHNQRTEAAFWGYRLNERKPQVGDLVCWQRGDPKIDFDTQLDGEYHSHADLIVAVEQDHVEIIGGNVGNSVSRRPLERDGAGFIRPVGAPGNALFAIMGTRLT